MQQEFPHDPELLTHSGNPNSASPTQHGPLHYDPNGLHPRRQGGSSGSLQHAIRRDSLDGVDADQLDERLRGLSLGSLSDGRTPAAGQRISDYENALLTPPTPRQALGFKVIKRSDSQSDGMQLTDFPNEILTHILSHLHPDSHASVSLVSKRFYELVTTSHAWRMAFLRYFPGHAVLDAKHGTRHGSFWTDENSDVIRSEARYFSRLTLLATWRSEYLFRTRLIRSLARGKPGTAGGIGSSIRTSQSGKKASAVLTYNSKLPWVVTSLHAVFSNGKKPPRAIHGQSDFGFATMSDPTTGKMEKWSLGAPFGFLQLNEAMPGLEPYGVSEGPAATPNVMDVSSTYGYLAGEGFPSGRPFFRSVHENQGRYLGGGSGVVDTYPDIPKIPEMSEGICSVWLAKSSAVPLNTQSMVGMLTGSTLGVVTSYAISSESSRIRLSNGEITARWVLSPGVPIISLKVDESFNQKRRSGARVWAVALNALGEVYYLTEAPVSVHDRSKTEDATKNAWYAGRSAYWHLVEPTRRVARPDDLDKNAVRGAYSPRSPSNSMNLSKVQMAAEAREIEKFLRHKPSYFRKVCAGWDMRRRLEVDFASDNGQGAGENIFVIDCGLDEASPAGITRYTRALIPQPVSVPEVIDLPKAQLPPSLFGRGNSVPATEEQSTPESQTPLSPPSTPMPPDSTALHDWQCSTLEIKGQVLTTITASALDCSSYALLTLAEDQLHALDESSTPGTPRPGQVVGEIPGRRARLLAVGTKTGAVIVWNSRDTSSSGVWPRRVIQTDSPEISSVGLTALYLVHGGSDGLVQAWDPLASTLEPIRTLNARSHVRVPRHMMAMQAPPTAERNHCAVNAIHLDADPTVLRGVVAFGAFLRYWSYSSTSHPAGRKRRLRHSDIHGRLASRRQGGGVHGYIAAETAELAREKQQKAKEQAYLRNRFGVGALGDLTEEEAIRYAQMISEEAFLQEEQIRASDSAADASLDTASSFSETTVDTVTPEPSVADTTPPTAAQADDDYEQQIQQAIRLSLMEGVNDSGQSPRGNSSGEYEFSVTFKAKGKNGRKGKSSSPGSPSASHTPVFEAMSGSSSRMEYRDDDLELALKLSMADQGISFEEVGVDVQHEEFPPLEHKVVGKGKDIQRW